MAEQVEITQPPDCGALSLTLKRGTDNEGNCIVAKWRNPVSAVDSQSAARWMGIDQVWEFMPSKEYSGTTYRTGSTTVFDMVGDRIWVMGGQNVFEGSTANYDRSQYHPIRSGRYLRSVTADIGAWNTFAHYYDDGSEMRGIQHTRATMNFRGPRQPGVTAELNTSTGIVTFTITTDAGADERERYDTMWCATRQDSANRNNSYKTAKVIRSWEATTETEVTYSYDLAQAQSISPGQWVCIEVMAYARGIAGDSAYSHGYYFYAYPNQPSITSIKASSVSSTGLVTVNFNISDTWTNPTDKVQLQRLTNVTQSTADAAASASGWSDIGAAVDNGVCTGLSDRVSDAMPDVKKHTWYRIAVTHGALTRYSAPVEATCLYRAKDAVADDVVKFISLVQGGDGESLVARMGWQNDDSNAVEIAWSKFEDAWESNNQPESFVIEWTDATAASGYSGSTTITIRGLEEATPYYVRARRVLIENGSVTSTGEWCPPAKSLYPITPVTAPTNVVLSAPSYVERGNGVNVMWTYSGAEQTGWQILDEQGGVKRVLAYGNGPAGATVIPAVAIKSLSSLKLSVSITTGGAWVESGQVPVGIMDAPTLSVSTASSLTSQPVSVTLTTDIPTCDATIYITSRGVSSYGPDGPRTQADGDIVWSETLSPTWAASNESYTATVVAPYDLDLHQGATYDVSASVTDRTTGLYSPTATDDFTVAWSHTAHFPSVTLDPNPAKLCVTITPSADESAAETDVCDVYRVSQDGAYLVAEGVPFEASVTDWFAPFSGTRGAELSYRLCTRTADGDLDWYDFSYAMTHSGLRVDWDGKSVELPYDDTSSDSWQKSFERRAHWDGSGGGYWDEGAERTASFTTDVVKAESREQRKLLSELATYAGPVFVRTSDGCAFQANIDVDNYNVSYNSAAVPVSLKATQVELTDEFKIAADQWEVDEEEPEEDGE